MSYKIGIDLEQVSRFKFLCENHPKLIKRLFFESELSSIKNNAKVWESLAGIWCAKEATLKAFSPFLSLEVNQIEIKKDSRGYPYPIIHHPEISKLKFSISLSISHTKEFASASTIIEII